MKGPFPWIAAAWLVLTIRGLAPVAAFGGWTTLLFLTGLALLACLIPAWRNRRGSAERVRADPATFLLLAHFPIWALSYFAVGAFHGVDAIDHLEFVRSVVFDRDLDIRNDDAVFGGDPNALDPNPVNMHGVGPAILWTPMYVVANALCGVIGQSCNGASRPYLAACTLTSMMASAWGLVAAYRLALRFASRGPALVATVGITWGTFLWWYMTLEPTMSHNLSFAASALALLLLTRVDAGRWGWFGAGAATGFAASIRFADGLIGVAAIPFVFASREGRSRREVMTNVLFLGMGLLVGFGPQMFAWWRIFGQPLVIPHGNDFLNHPTTATDTLFSPQSGLFTWSPLLYLAIPGILAVRRMGWRFAIGAWSALFLVYVTNARAHWWAGAGFGARRYCTVLPLFAVGLALSFDALNRFLKRHPMAAPVALVAAFSGWNLLLVEGARQDAWVWDGPVSFSQTARVSADLIERRIGSPFSLPGALWESLRTGQPIAEYQAPLYRRTYSRFTLRFGDADLVYLASGFTAPQGQGDELHRSTRNGAIEVSLHRPEPYVVAFRLAGSEGQTLQVAINGRPAFACPLVQTPSVCEGSVDAGFLVTGTNRIEVRVEPVNPRTSDARLYALELVPTRNAHDPRPAVTPLPADEARP